MKPSRQTSALTAGMLALIASGAVHAASIMGPTQITATTDLPLYAPAFPVSALVDGITAENNALNGFAANVGVGLVTLTFDQSYDLSSFVLWNDVNVFMEGIKDFKLHFYDAGGDLMLLHPDGSETQHLAYELGLAPFATLVFLLGCAMGVGKAAVYKHIPEYFPGNVGSVGGLVGMFGGLGGFLLPLLFAYTKALSGFPSSTFLVLFVLTAACLVWMHWTVVHMLHHGSPELSRHLERP